MSHDISRPGSTPRMRRAMLRTGLVCLGVLALAPASATAQDAYPFVGRWDCEGSTFAFTDTTFDDGALNRAILAVVPEGSGFILTLPADQEVVVSEFKEGKMVWLYWSTGERRVCTRLE